MRIVKLVIENYKSFRSIELDLQDLTVLVGSNAAGKTNLADCLDFISEVYRHGLEIAVSRKGGYENIAHRRQRRTRGAVVLSTTVEHKLKEDSILGLSVPNNYQEVRLRTTHRFALTVKSSSMRAAFQVENEFFQQSVQVDGGWVEFLRVERDSKKSDVAVTNREALAAALANSTHEGDIYTGLGFMARVRSIENFVTSTELLMNSLGRFAELVRSFVAAMADIRVFQVSPIASREAGVPTPRPELDRRGSNLPAMVDLLQTQHQESWNQVMEAMSQVLPGLEAIDVVYNTARTLSLSFRESHIGKPWTAAEVSDGTIQTLALLVAIFDPRASALVLEEPENSVHPWIIRRIISSCKEASKTRQILITTHSPIVVNQVKPDQVWVMWRSEGASRAAPLLQLDGDFREMWESGKVSTFDFLDSGAVLEALPPAPMHHLGRAEDPQ